MFTLRSLQENDTHFIFSNPDWSVEDLKEMAQAREKCSLRWISADNGWIALTGEDENEEEVYAIS